MGIVVGICLILGLAWARERVNAEVQADQSAAKAQESMAESLQGIEASLEFHCRPR